MKIIGNREVAQVGRLGARPWKPPNFPETAAAAKFAQPVMESLFRGGLGIS
jgi:hypothetical protein